VSAATASTTDPSDALIAQDVASGKITEEQGFVFRVYAAFGSLALPVKYRSSVVLTLDSPIGRELPKRFSTLSPAAQSAVTPYLMPPIYKGSWGDAATAPAGPVAPPRSRTLDAVDCASGLPPTGWATKTTANFRIHYRSSVPSSHWY